MKRGLFLAYGLVCYVIFLGTFLYAIGFVGNYWVPLGMDRGRDGTSLGLALAIDAALLAVFAFQHSIMARKGFKRWWTRIVPPVVERSTFVLASSLALCLLFWQWRPIGGAVWDVSQGMLATVLLTVSLIGWGIVLVSTFLIDHFELFGLRQVVTHFVGRAPSEPRFATPGLYKAVRHPIYLGFIVAFWSTPVMTWGHFVFAGATTAYILLGIRLEERDLIGTHGDAYRAYRRRVPMLFPLRPRSK